LKQLSNQQLELAVHKTQ